MVILSIDRKWFWWTLDNQSKKSFTWEVMLSIIVLLPKQSEVNATLARSQSIFIVFGQVTHMTWACDLYPLVYTCHRAHAYMPDDTVRHCHLHACHLCIRLAYSATFARWRAQGCNWSVTWTNLPLGLNPFLAGEDHGSAEQKHLIKDKVSWSIYFFTFWTFLVFPHTNLPFKRDWLFTDCWEAAQSIIGNNQLLWGFSINHWQ